MATQARIAPIQVARAYLPIRANSKSDILPMEKSMGLQPSQVGFPASPGIACIELSPNEVLHHLHRPKFPRAPRYVIILEENRQHVNPCATKGVYEKVVGSSASQEGQRSVLRPLQRVCGSPPCFAHLQLFHTLNSKNKEGI